MLELLFSLCLVNSGCRDLEKLALRETKTVFWSPLYKFSELKEPQGVMITSTPRQSQRPSPPIMHSGGDTYLSYFFFFLVSVLIPLLAKAKVGPWRVCASGKNYYLV